MREIIPRSVWIGNARDAIQVKAILDQEIQAVVDLAMEEPAHTYPRDVVYCRFPLLDSDGNPRSLVITALQTLTTLINQRIRTLVVCGGGMSRSPAMTAVALSRVHGGTPAEWLERIAAIGPHDVAPALWNELVETAAQL